MATDVSAPILRGFLIPDERIGIDTFSASLSSVTQAGPKPGVPEPQQEGALVVRASGSQGAGEAKRFRTVQGGFPGADGAEFVWEDDGDTLWTGWEPPNAVSQFQWIDRSTTANKWKPYDAITRANGTVIVLAIKDTPQVVVQRRITATLWTEVEVYDNGTAYTDTAGCCLCELPSGRLMCFYTVEQDPLYRHIRTSYSDDGGATWYRASARCSPTSVVVRSMKAVYYRGCVVALLHVEALTPDDELRQWVSQDDGLHFRETDASTTEVHGYPDLTVCNGRLTAAFVTLVSGTYSAVCVSVGAPAESMLSAERVVISAAWDWARVSGGTFTRGECILKSDEAGVLWAGGVDLDAGSTQTAYVFRSADGGATWTTGDPVLTLDDASTNMHHIRGTWHGGRLVLVSAHDASPATADDSLSAVYLGGYSTVTRPEQTIYPQYGLSLGYERDYLPFDLPENTGTVWTAGTSGAPTVSITSSGLRVQHTGGADATNWTAAPTTTLETGAVLEFAIKVVAGTAAGVVRITDGVGVSYSVRVEVTTTAIVLKDDFAGTTIATVTTNAGASGVIVRLDVGEATTGKASAWYAPLTTGTRRAFVSIGSSTSLTSSTPTTTVIQLATNSGNASTDVYWGRWSYQTNRDSTSTLFAGQTNPQALTGRAWSSAPVYVDDDLDVSATHGPTVPGDVFHVDTRYDYPVTAITVDVAASPRVGWRSTQTAAAESLVWELSSTLSQSSRLLGPTLGLAIFGGNWRTGTLYGRDGVGTWNAIASIDAASGQSSCPFTREGDTILVNTGGSGSAADYIRHGALVGAYLDCGSGNVYRIDAHSEGAWTTSATKHPRFKVSGTATAHATSGTCAIIPRDHVTIVHDIGKYNAYKLTIDAQDTYEDDFRIGTLCIGPFFFFGLPYSYGRMREHEAGTELYETRGRTRRTIVRAPARRSVTMDWGDWVNARQALTASTVPDYLHAATGGAEPVATRADTVQSLATLVAYSTRGADLPVVYCERIAKSANAAATIRLTDREGFMLGRIESAARLEHRRGVEGASEVNTTAPITIVEEV
jgi:hypothetical protein